MLSQKDTHIIWEQAIQVRQMLEYKYGRSNDNMMGKCIEASDILEDRLIKLGYKAEAKQVWCLYEYFESCTDYCFEEHWMVMVRKGNDKRYIDVTMNQFQWAFSKQLPKVYIAKELPKFYLTRKPGKATLDKCGWNDWYEYGDYENNFVYW